MTDTTAKHTAERWHWDGERGYVYAEGDDHDRAVAVIPHTRYARYRARLVAAAPTLAEWVAERARNGDASAKALLDSLDLSRPHGVE